MKTLKMEKCIPVRMIALDAENGYMDIADLELSYVIATEVDDPTAEKLLQAQLDQNVGFAKINIFVENMMDNNILVTVPGTEILGEKLDIFENNIVMLPDLTEVTLMSTLYAKFNTITGRDTNVKSISIKNIRDNVTYSFDLGDEEDDDYTELPTATEWLGDYPYWEKTWWERDDISTYDKGAETLEELESWKIHSRENRVDELNRQTFIEIEKEVTSVFDRVTQERDKNTEHAGELIEIDFKHKK